LIKSNQNSSNSNRNFQFKKSSEATAISTATNDNQFNTTINVVSQNNNSVFQEHSTQRNSQNALDQGLAFD